MDRLEMFVLIADNALDTRRKRHIVGGTLMSISLLFGGLAFTIITLKPEGENNEY